MARPRQVSDQDILDAARQCFLDHGPAVSTTVIADAVGLSQAALFKRFGTKQALMTQALLPPEEPPWLQLLAGGPDERPIPIQLEALGRAMALFFREMIPCISTLRASLDMREVLKGAYEVPPPARGRMALQRWLDEAVRLGRIRAIDTRAVAETFIGAMHGRAFMRHILGEAEVADQFERELADLLWNGLAPTETP